MMNSESLSPRSRSESDHSGSSDAEVSALGNFSLNEELRNIGKMLSVLKECNILRNATLVAQRKMLPNFHLKLISYLLRLLSI